MVEIEQDAVRVDHVLLGGEQTGDDSAEYAQQPFPVDLSGKELTDGNLRGDVELDVALVVHLGKLRSGQPRDLVVGQHTQTKGVQHVVGLDLVDAIGHRALALIGDVHVRFSLLFVQLRYCAL